MTDIPLPDMPAGPSPEDLLLIGLRKRYLELGAMISTYEEERENIKARARRLGVGTHPVGDGRFTVSEQNKFDPDLAEKVLAGIDPNLVKACSVSKVDSALAKNVLSPALYEQCKRKNVGEDKVTIT